MRIAFFGTPAPAVPALHALLAHPGIEVVRVVTNPDRPKGRGYALTPPPVKVAAVDAGVEVAQPVRPKEIAGDLADLELDACAIVAYGSLLPGSVLSSAGHGFVNLHFSLLPAWRGAAPVPHAILAGDAQTGVSCFVLDEGMDTGPVLTERRTPIRAGETAGELTDRLAQLGAPALVEAVVGLVEQTLTPAPQPEDGVSYASKLTAEDARLDWSLPAETLERAVRAYNPMPGAHTTFAGTRLKVHRATVVTGRPHVPGTVLDPAAHSEPSGPVVACGRGGLRLDEVQPAGKGRMSGVAFANGHRPAGVVLGIDGGPEPGHPAP